jgi:hypothetical protein
MIRPRYLPPGACFDDPSVRLDRPEVELVSYALAGEALRFVFDWIMEGDVSQRSLRFQWATRLKQDFGRAVAIRSKLKASSPLTGKPCDPA